MQCQSCKQHMATIHLTEISDGQRTEAHLCERCAQKQGLAVKNQIPLNELLSTLLAVQSESTGDSFSSPDMTIETPCPQCGMTLKNFQKTTLLGCPDDYEVFGKTLELLIEKSHNGNIEHHGKVPSRAPADTKGQIELIELRRRLDTAVRAEDYEAAAKLRDRIEQIK